MKLRAAISLVGFCSLAHCAAASPEPSSSPSVSMRLHPSEHAMTHAFERVREDAVRCLRPGDHVTVRGAFHGEDGAFAIERVESTSGTVPYAVETCVRVASEHAHVRPFRDEQSAFSFPIDAMNAPVSDTGVAPTAPMPMFGSDGGVYAASTAGGAFSPPVSGTMTIASRPSPVDLIRREADALQRCYEQACERDHTIAGHVELHLVLDAAGHITRLSSRSDSTNEDATLMELVSRCIESHVRLIQFGPQTYPGQEVVVPLAFQPGGIPID